MSRIIGIDKIVYGIENFDESRRFFNDWGLNELENSKSRIVFETLEGSQILLMDIADESLPAAVEEGPTVRRVIWAVADESSLAEIETRLVEARLSCSTEDGMLLCEDPVGMSLGFRVSSRRHVETAGSATNAYGRITRVDAPSPIYQRATPARLSHVVFHTDIYQQHLAFYTDVLGFHLSDCYPGEGAFLRCKAEGGHHDLFLIVSPAKPRGLNHVSFMVRDIYEVFGGGIHMNRCGWTTQIGPGRHPISSAMFWYVQCPSGALTEYYADEDHLTAAWQPREFKRTPENFAEWSILGGIDSDTRKQVGGRGNER